MISSAWFDRGRGALLGKFTLQDEAGVKAFDKIPCNSGQFGYLSTDWVSGKSPTPRGTWRLWTHSYNRGMKPGYSGIGEFFPISSGDEPSLIHGPDGITRIGVGFHPENGIPGSIGCIAVQPYDEFLKMADALHRLNAAGIPWIPLHVIGGLTK